MNKKQDFIELSGDTGDLDRGMVNPKTGRPMYKLQVKRGVNPRGHPTEKDWEGCLRWLVAWAAINRLPEGKGATEKLRRIIWDWFDDQGFDAGDTACREQARKILDEYHRLFPNE